MFAFLLSLSLTSPAVASPSMELVYQTGSSQVKRISTSVPTKGAAITPSTFAAVILDANSYPLTATYMGVPALLDCRMLDKRADGYTIVYERLGGNAVVKSRHFVIALRTRKVSDTEAQVEWHLVKHDFDGSTYTGPYASALNAHPDAVYMPFNHGTWTFSATAGTVTYAVEIDPGGSVPSWVMSESALMVFPRELLKQKWGIAS